MDRNKSSPYPGYRDAAPDYKHLWKPLERRVSMVIGLAAAGFFLPVILYFLNLIPGLLLVFLAPLCGFVVAILSVRHLVLRWEQAHFSTCPECGRPYEHETHNAHRFIVCHPCKNYVQGVSTARNMDEWSGDD